MEPEAHPHFSDEQLKLIFEEIINAEDPEQALHEILQKHYPKYTLYRLLSKSLPGDPKDCDGTFFSEKGAQSIRISPKPYSVQIRQIMVEEIMKNKDRFDEFVNPYKSLYRELRKKFKE